MNSTYTITHIGEINDNFVINLQSIISSIPSGFDTIYLQISSLGGSVTAGITAYNYLKSLPFKLHTHNLGEVSSAAILPFLAGDIRTAENVSKFMIHPLAISIGNDLPFYKVEEVLKNIECDIKNYASILQNEIPEFCKNNDIEDCLKHKSVLLLPKDCYAVGILTPNAI